jgi:hypothetical protein
MNVELAREIVDASFASSATLQALLPTMRANLDAKEYRQYARAVAKIIDMIGVSLIAKATEAQPQLVREIEDRLRPLA